MNPPNSPDKSADDATEATKPGRGLLYLRSAILLALSIGLLAFGYFAVNDLLAYNNTPAQHTPDTLPYQPNTQPSAIAPGALNQNLGQQFVDSFVQGASIPLDHDPANVPPYPGSVTTRRELVPGQSIAEERATYEVNDSQVANIVDQIVEHYMKACGEHGFTLVDRRAMEINQGGLLLTFRKDSQQLTVAIHPKTISAAPPMSLPATIIVVQFRYPMHPRQP